MSKNPSNFFDSMQDARKKDSERSQRGYESKILQKLVSLFDYTVTDVRSLYGDENEDEPLLELKHQQANPELDVLFMERIPRQTLTGIIYQFDQAPVWKSFCRLAEKENLEILGLIFPVKDYSDWIIHTMGLKCVPGRAHIVIPSKRTDLRDIVLEPLQSFIEGRKNE